MHLLDESKNGIRFKWFIQRYRIRLPFDFRKKKNYKIYGDVYVYRTMTTHVVSVLHFVWCHSVVCIIHENADAHWKFIEKHSLNILRKFLRKYFCWTMANERESIVWNWRINKQNTQIDSMIHFGSLQLQLRSSIKMQTTQFNCLYR